MDTIFEAYQKSLADGIFSRQEKREIIHIIEGLQADKHDLARLRSHIFDVARERATPQNIAVILDWLEIANKTLLVNSTPKPRARSILVPTTTVHPLLFGNWNPLSQRSASAYSRLAIILLQTPLSGARGTVSGYTSSRIMTKSTITARIFSAL